MIEEDILDIKLNKHNMQ